MTSEDNVGRYTKQLLRGHVFTDGVIKTQVSHEIALELVSEAENWWFHCSFSCRIRLRYSQATALTLNNSNLKMLKTFNKQTKHTHI